MNLISTLKKFNTRFLIYTQKILLGEKIIYKYIKSFIKKYVTRDHSLTLNDSIFYYIYNKGKKKQTKKTFEWLFIVL